MERTIRIALNIMTLPHPSSNIGGFMAPFWPYQRWE